MLSSAGRVDRHSIRRRISGAKAPRWKIDGAKAPRHFAPSAEDRAAENKPQVPLRAKLVGGSAELWCVRVCRANVTHFLAKTVDF